MNCFDQGHLRAWLDHELDSAATQAVSAHLQHCQVCSRLADSLSQLSRQIAGRLPGVPAHVSTSPAATDDATAAAWLRFQSRRASEEQGTAPAHSSRLAWLRSPRLLAPAAAILLVVAVFSNSVGRAWAARVLEMLRVQQVAAIPVDSSVFNSPQGRQAGQMLNQLISSNLVVTLRPGPPRAAATASAASQAAGFAVRLPAGFPAPGELLVHGPAAFQITLDRGRLQSILDEAGRPDLQLPASLQNALVAVHIPRRVTARFGNCPAPVSRGGKPAMRRQAPSPGCTVLLQAPSPVVSVPPGLDLPQLAAVGLQLTGMSQAQAESFVHTINWSSTLVIPVPEQIASSQTIPVDGARGILIQQTSRPGGAYNLIWTRRGILYSIVGSGDPAAAEQMADSLP